MSTEKTFKPYVASKTNAREFTFRAMFLGLILGLLFALANAYLALKIGMTVSAAIPYAILSIAIL